MAYARVFGLPEGRAELRSGQLLSYLANLMRSEKTDRVFSPADFRFVPTLSGDDDGAAEESEEVEFDPVAMTKQLAELLGKKD